MAVALTDHAGWPIVLVQLLLEENRSRAIAHIDRIVIQDPGHPERTLAPDMMIDEATYARLMTLGDASIPTVVFAAHLANWEIPALAPHSFGFKTSILYRRPNIGVASNTIVAMRETSL